MANSITAVKLIQQRVGSVPDGIWGKNTARAVQAYFGLTRVEAAHFFGQLACETGNFKVFSENLNYSAKRLLEVFPRYFKTLESAQAYAGNPVAIANKVYANRMGNGPEESGDGWRYRGRGTIQLTGKNNYIAFSKVKPEVLTNPDLVALAYAFDAAKWYFDHNNLWAITKQGIGEASIKRLTKAINGGYNGLETRTKKTYEYYGILK